MRRVIAPLRLSGDLHREAHLRKPGARTDASSPHPECLLPTSVRKDLDEEYQTLITPRAASSQPRISSKSKP